MDAKTLKALKGSIKKWEAIVAGTGTDLGSDNCPLCIQFSGYLDCSGCPVAEAGFPSCCGSPYDDWRQAVDCRPSPLHDKATDDETVMCAVLELEFLKSLLPGAK